MGLLGNLGLPLLPLAGGGSVAAADITDAGATGEALVQAETPAEARAELVDATTYTGASSGWTAVTGVGSAAASGTDYDLSIPSGESGASEIYPTSDHPRLHRDVSAQIASETDWSITIRVGALSGSSGARLVLAVGAVNDARGAALVLAASGVVELGSWVSTSYSAAATAAGALAVDGTGYARLVGRGGAITAQWGTGTSTVPPTSWVQVGGSVVLTGLVAERLSLHLAQWSGSGITASVDDVRVQAGA